jgi:hypothetical protein
MTGNRRLEKVRFNDGGHDLSGACCLWKMHVCRYKSICASLCVCPRVCMPLCARGSVCVCVGPCVCATVAANGSLWESGEMRQREGEDTWRSQSLAAVWINMFGFRKALQHSINNAFLTTHSKWINEEYRSGEVPVRRHYCANILSLFVSLTMSFSLSLPLTPCRSLVSY